MAARAPMLAAVPPAPLPILLVGRAVDWAMIVIGATMAVLVSINVSLHVDARDLAWVT